MSEVERYLTTYEEIDELVKQRVISHLKGHSTELKDGNNNDGKALNSNTKNLNKTNHATGRSRKTANSPLSNAQTQPDNVSIKSEFNNNSISHQVNNNLQNLHNLPEHSLPPSVSPSSLSTSSQSSNSVTVKSPSSSVESDNSQIYIPYNLLKNKILSYNSTIQNKSSNSLINMAHDMTNYKPNQTQLLYIR